MDNEKLLVALEKAANFLRGMCFDPRLPSEVKQAANSKAADIDEIVNEAINAAKGGK